MAYWVECDPRYPENPSKWPASDSDFRLIHTIHKNSSPRFSQKTVRFHENEPQTKSSLSKLRVLIKNSISQASFKIERFKKKSHGENFNGK